jgi:hypothetical protein
MKNDDNYQGWKNRETWVIALHLNNDWEVYNNVRAYIREGFHSIDISCNAMGWTP